MNKKGIRKALEKGPPPKRLSETQRLCLEMLHNQQMDVEEERTGFWTFLSDMFRYAGLRLWGTQILMLTVVCAGVLSVYNAPNAISLFAPMFALACIPSLFQSQTFGMCELEAATRASVAQIVLAKLILAGAADLFCLSITLAAAAAKSDFSSNVLQLILYAVVPLLGCMATALWCMRTCSRNSYRISMIACFAAIMLAEGLFRLEPQLFELSALGLWIAAFAAFTGVFARELCFLMEAGKEGKIYGTIA
ncbi:MAG: hypothetical protein LBU32_29945 [Clostridiales bacterium]|jgi:hypothetical protein|nr:hypothetical protein [Clostridiales bacterium]